MKIIVRPYTVMSSTNIAAATNTRKLSNNLVRVKSSNIWSYGISVNAGTDTGDVMVQFKSNSGGPGDIYIYYDVPVKLYRRWQSAPSKGHYFWIYLRGNFRYAKLTGDKRTKLKHGI